MLVGVPVVLVGLPLGYLILTRGIFRIPSVDLPGIDSVIQAEKAKLGPVRLPEVAVATVFVLTALGWVFQPLIAQVVPLMTDTVIALLGGLALFVIPARPRKGIFLMDWKACRKMPWDVFLLFGGGLSLAASMEKHGVAAYLGSLFSFGENMPFLTLMLVICLAILLLTELTSNTATAATFLPIVATVAIGLGQSPLLLLIPAAMAANCSFMLPVGTPPNAIIFGTGQITLPQMARAGLWMNVAFTLLIVGIVYLLGPAVFGIETNTLPAWVTAKP